MALRSLTTRMWRPAAAYALRRHPVPPSASALSRFLGTTRGQNDIGAQRRSIDVERIRSDLKRLEIEDEIMRENIRRGSKFYKTLELSSYASLSVSVTCFTACELIVRSREDKGHAQPT